MKLGVYSMRDNLTGFLEPQVSINDAVAIRAFEQACSNTASVIGFRSSDFSLYKIGEFDTETGFVESVPLEVIR